MKAIGRALALGGLLLAAGGGSAVAGESAWDGPPAGSPPGYDRFERPEFRASMAKELPPRAPQRKRAKRPPPRSCASGPGRPSKAMVGRMRFRWRGRRSPISCASRVTAWV